MIYAIHQNRNSVKKISFWIVSVFLLGIGIALANKITSDYKPKYSELMFAKLANYEKQFGALQNKPQPTITKVVTTVDLFPTRSSYVIKGNYVLENKTQLISGCIKEHQVNQSASREESFSVSGVRFAYNDYVTASYFFQIKTTNHLFEMASVFPFSICLTLKMAY